MGVDELLDIFLEKTEVKICPYQKEFCYKIIQMSDKEAADILRKLRNSYNPGRLNGKSETLLRMTMALNKAIYALEKGEDNEKRC